MYVMMYIVIQFERLGTPTGQKTNYAESWPAWYALS